MTTASATYHPGFGSVDQIISANTMAPAGDHPSLEPGYCGSPLRIRSTEGYRTTLAYRSSVGDQLQKFMSLIPSLARDLYTPHQDYQDSYLEAKNTVDALMSVSDLQERARVTLYLSDNPELCDLALQLTTAANNRQDVDSVIVELEEDPESADLSLFVTAVVSTEDFHTWDRIDADILDSILQPNASINRARVVFSIAHADSI